MKKKLQSIKALDFMVCNLVFAGKKAPFLFFLHLKNNDSKMQLEALFIIKCFEI